MKHAITLIGEAAVISAVLAVMYAFLLFAGAALDALAPPGFGL